MKTIIRNFISILRRFKMATGLNIIGLSVAFAAFMVIMMQLDWDYNYCRELENHEQIFRVESVNDGSAIAVVTRPMANAICSSSPHVVAGSLHVPFWPPLEFSVEKNGTKNHFEEARIRVEASFPDVITFDMVEGSTDVLKQPDYVLLPQSIATKLFGDESAIGQTLLAEEENYTVGGVYRDFQKNSILTNGIYMTIPEKENINSWGNRSYELLVKLDDAKNSELILDNFLSNFDFSLVPQDDNWVRDERFRLNPIDNVHFSQGIAYDFNVNKTSKQTLFLLLTIALVILLIAGINFTNFSTALTPMRIKSINTQKVLGGDEGTIRRSLIIEAIAIAVVSYLIAVGLVYMLPHTFIAQLLDADPTLTAHPLIVGGTALLAVATGCLAGLYPSYYMTSFAPALVLKGSFGLSPKGRKLRSLLIGMQFISSFALIIGASFMYLQNDYMRRAPLGFDKDQLIVTKMNSVITENRETFANQVKHFAGIEDVTFSEVLLSSQQQYMGWGRQYKGKGINFECLPVDYNFLDILSVSITEGRSFRPEDALTNHGALVFNEKARTMYDIELGGMIDSMQIIGFMPDVKFATMHLDVVPMAFFLWGQINWGSEPRYAYIKVKAGSDMHGALEHVKATLSSLSPNYTFNVSFFDEVFNNTYMKERHFASLISLFSLIAIFISIVGVFGLVVFESEYRRKEIGIRKVLGSSTRQILLLFNKSYIRILCLCFVIAAPIAYYAIIRWLENFAFRTPIYWWVFLLSFVAISLVTVITVTFQNYWAANENPINSIKSE